MIMRGAFWSLWSGARLSEAELESVACGRVAAEGWNQPVDTEHLPVVDHGTCSGGPWTMLVVDHAIDRPSSHSKGQWTIVLMSSFTGFGKKLIHGEPSD